MTKMTQVRLDALLVMRGLAPSREKAQALTMAGDVSVEGRTVLKPDFRLAVNTPIAIREKYPYVSRGALKIETAVREFGLHVQGTRVLDIGISTGGFSDFLLQNGARAVAGVDVNIQQVDDRLRGDPRVLLIEKNARFFDPADIPFAPDLVVVDLSFISILKVLPRLRVFPNAQLLVLVKPQFEAERGRVGKGGVVRDEQRRQSILAEVSRKIGDLGFSIKGVHPAGARGRKGNQEYFFLLALRAEDEGDNDGENA